MMLPLCSLMICSNKHLPEQPVFSNMLFFHDFIGYNTMAIIHL